MKRKKLNIPAGAAIARTATVIVAIDVIKSVFAKAVVNSNR
jgi:hypothetical protein